MNKSELINSLSEETMFSKKDITRVLDSFTRIIERTLKKGEKVSLTGFGSWWILAVQLVRASILQQRNVLTFQQ